MSLTSSYLRSLLLTSLFSFLAPLLLVGGTISSLLLIRLIPELNSLSRLGFELVQAFLKTFGNGSTLEGLLVIGFACALVGALFDTYIYLHHRFCQQ